MRYSAQLLRERMAPGYGPRQAEWILRTARRNPGIPVAFDSADGGRDEIVAEEEAS